VAPGGGLLLASKGIVAGQPRVLGSRFARLGYRAGRILRSQAGRLLLRKAVLKDPRPKHYTGGEGHRQQAEGILRNGDPEHLAAA
jgi:hypothetical protein